jgi:hypothetical protein
VSSADVLRDCSDVFAYQQPLMLQLDSTIHRLSHRTNRPIQESKKKQQKSGEKLKI